MSASPLSRPVAVFHRSRPWCLSVCPGPIMSCLRKAWPFFSLAALRFSMRFHTSCNFWCCSYSLTLMSTAVITSRTWASAFERLACSSVASEGSGRRNTRGLKETSCCTVYFQLKSCMLCLASVTIWPCSQQVAVLDWPWVYCRILSSSTGYFVILWVTSKMHSGISLRRTKELLPCCLKKVTSRVMLLLPECRYAFIL